MSSEWDDKTGIYVHIPFCIAKCYYCDFLSFPLEHRPEGYSLRYKKALIREIKAFPEIKEVSTVYFGGGTPTALPHEFLAEILNEILLLPLDSDPEITIEVNPGTVSLEALNSLRRAGFNRLSIGAQTLNDELLKKIGRIHNSDDFFEAYKNGRKAGFKNISADIIFGLPGQLISDLTIDLKKIIELKPEHISAYSLIIEPGTKFENMPPIDEETDRQMFELIKDTLRHAGYIHYEVSNFCLPGYESRHNSAYWKRGNYIGAGLGAHSFNRKSNIRYRNTRDIDFYIDSSPKNLTRDLNHISEEEAIEEFLFLGLRMVEGISLDEFHKCFNRDLMDLFGKNIEKLIQAKMLCLKDDRLLFTPKGLDLSNYVLGELLYRH